MASATRNTVGHRITMKASGAITANRVVVQHTTEGEAIASSAITQEALGVSIDTVADTELVTVETMSGTLVRLTAGAAIDLGAQVMPQASGAGKVITAAGATALSCGVAMMAATADGDIITVLFRPSVKSPANA